jgi:hypothetical protein
MLERTKEILNYETMELQPLTLERWKAAVNPRRHPQRLGWTQFLNGISWRFLIHSTSSFWIREVAETKGIWPRQLLNG